MPPSSTPGSKWRRAVLATVLVAGVLLMAGPAPSTATPASDPMGGMVATEGMPHEHTSPDGVLGTACAAMCGDLLEACLAVLTLLVTAAMALPGARTRAGPRVCRSARAHRWAVGESPPWSVPSLAQLSVLRV